MSAGAAAAAAAARVPLSLYVHWPYCSFLCKFCAFSKARVPSQGVDHEQITNALIRELRTSLAPHRDKELRSIYFGGGTPSLSLPQNIGRIIEEANKMVPLTANAEVTLESNPTSAEVASMLDFKQAGVNRYSIGIQTLNDKTLRRMGRLHTGAEGLAAVDRAKVLFPGRVTFDMIFGFESQTLRQWQAELETALSHADRHISIYQLTVEPGTPLFRDQCAQRVVLPSDDVQAQMYELTVSMCRDRAFQHYEVSSYASHPSAESAHNKGYWRGQQWVGIGPSAHSRYTDPVSGQRISSVRIPDTRRWAQQCESKGHGTGKESVVTSAEAKQEAVVLGLRTLRGISDRCFRNVSDGQSLASYLSMDRVQHYIEEGCLHWNAQTACLAPSERGLQVIDSILLEIMP
ncbi:radical S-adenosyl methionine domain-containing protein 1 [Coemansia sp. BCRC 34301]|nr:radical S-adenosyl methionine domain-containing protein 1 [Coemansia sp. BCRC 34301]